VLGNACDIVTVGLWFRTVTSLQLRKREGETCITENCVMCASNLSVEI
jgi:hypothetical protein